MVVLVDMMQTSARPCEFREAEDKRDWMMMTKDRGQGIVDTQGPIKIGREIAGCTWSVGLSIDDRGKLTVVEISK
jgi:hypothetical protein